MYNELFFGVKRRPKRSPKRSPKRRRSPVRKCNSKISLAKLRKLAMENGVNVFSEAKVAISKRTGEPKKPKMVGCSTLMKRLRDAGLSNLYKVRPVEVVPEVVPDMVLPQEVFPELPQQVDPVVQPQQVPAQPGVNFEDDDQQPVLEQNVPLLQQMDYGMVYRSGARPRKDQKHAGVIVVNGREHVVFKGLQGGLYYLRGKKGTKVYVSKDQVKRKRRN